VIGGRTRVSGVSVLAAAVLVLLPALAWLQYSWLDQIADADRERRARTLQTAAGQLAQDFDAELGKAGFALQIEPSIVEQQQWSQFAAKYQAWADNAASTRIVQSIYFVERPLDGPGADAGPLRVWNPSTHTFEVIDWPSELASIRARFLHEPTAVVDMSRPAVRWTAPGGGREGDRRRDERREERGERSLAEAGRGGRGQSRAEAPRGEGGRGGQRLLFPPVPMPAGDPQSLIMPVLRITGPAPTGDARQTPDVKLLGFTVIRFDLTALATDVLPGLVKKHLYDGDGQTEFAVAVVSRNDPSQTLFESQPGAAAMAEASPDAAVSLLGPTTGQFLFMARGDRRGAAPPRPPPPPPPGVESKVVVNVIETARNDGSGVSVQRTAFAGEGHWRLIVKHRAGSLEAAVAAARTRNFVLSSSILALLAAAIGLIVVSARRADRLARQQIEFVAAVSHELRTPVSVIGAAAGNLADGLVDSAGRVKTYGATIQTEARRLGETVERVLQLAGIAAGSAAATRTALAVPALVEEAVKATRYESEAAGVTVEVAIADELLHSPTDPSGVQRVVGDPVALRSAIQNLISNAIKYGGDARWVRVSAKSLTHKMTRITVEDRGLGIASEDRKHIFEPFYRGREAVSRQIQGSGLGLHLVRRIIEAHGGSVSVHSEPGKGSTFTIDLPGVHEKMLRRGHSPAAMSPPRLKPGPS
jgi:two-component system, OmpR family, sensor histidine kinase SenX3